MLEYTHSYTNHVLNIKFKLSTIVSVNFYRKCHCLRLIKSPLSTNKSNNFYREFCYLSLVHNLFYVAHYTKNQLPSSSSALLVSLCILHRCPSSLPIDIHSQQFKSYSELLYYLFLKFKMLILLFVYNKNGK